ncbi:dynamin family protein [Paraburkholderia nemoris]|uniref:dynamin family protein n=1 Tax=Paraburkholderia nemoris TaxID=2793076 RepID=UPI001B19D4E4|nr:dynamin family protein [Paraburkholderia nemoris]CAE6773844.1 hypothetical protein R75777_04027 [Paraburkholderia nemoris]
MNKQAMRELLAGDEIQSLAKRYDPQQSDVASPRIGERLHAYAVQLSAERFVLPVAGIQGSGKSTLLNALAFDVPVLPIDADETTCVPVEICWAGESNPKALVHYTDGRVEALPCTEEALRSVVHNENNPGNEKQVSRVVLTSNREMLRHGLVLVDLPGVGSLTSANLETTQRYLREAVGVIFMLRTVPPLTRSEAMFVSLQWASLRTALFVQNRWNDESDDEALAGRDHNVKVLQQIAGQVGITLDKPPVVRLVNGYDALRATLNDDPSLAGSSGLAAMCAELGRFGEAWSERVGGDVLVAARTELARLAAIVAQRVHETTLDRGQHEAHMAEEAQSFIRQIELIDKHADKMRADADSFRREVRQQLRSWSTATAEQLRNRMRTKMRAGILDGQRLVQALSDEQEEATNDIFGEIEADARALQDRLRNDLEGLDVWNGQAPDLRFAVHKEESMRFENLAERLAGVAGGLGGMWAGMEAGALVGSAGGPVGAVVGGLLGALAGAFLGRKAKEGVTALRAKAVEGEVFAAIDQYVEATAAALNEIAAGFGSVLNESLDQWRAAKLEAFESERERSLELLNMSAAEKADAAQRLIADAAQIDAVRSKVEELAT